MFNVIVYYCIDIRVVTTCRCDADTKTTLKLAVSLFDSTVSFVHKAQRDTSCARASQQPRVVFVSANIELGCTCVRLRDISKPNTFLILCSTWIPVYTLEINVCSPKGYLRRIGTSA